MRSGVVVATHSLDEDGVDGRVDKTFPQDTAVAL